MAADTTRVVNNLGPLYWASLLFHLETPAWGLEVNRDYIIISGDFGEVDRTNKIDKKATWYQHPRVPAIDTGRVKKLTSLYGSHKSC